MNRYFINTTGSPIILLRFLGVEPNISSELDKFKVVECTEITYNVFKYTRVNLKSKDKTKWLRSIIWKKLLELNLI
jgi:hypothetical protein